MEMNKINKNVSKNEIYASFVMRVTLSGLLAGLERGGGSLAASRAARPARGICWRASSGICSRGCAGTGYGGFLDGFTRRVYSSTKDPDKAIAHGFSALTCT